MCLPSDPLPPAVRWLPANRAGDLAPQLPAGAAGCLIYRFGTPSEQDTRAAQLEAIDVTGHRRPFVTAGKRPSVRGSRFAGGARVFEARGGTGAVHLCEGPLDALALVTRARFGLLDLGTGRVVGSAGTSGFTMAACAGAGPVTIWPDGDRPGQTAARTLRAALRRTGQPVRIVLAPAGMDVADLAGRAVAREARR